MPTKIVIRNNDYHDSMLLMKINHRIMAVNGIKRAAILMGTDPNKRLLEKYGFEGYGIEIVDNIALEIEPNQFNEFYLHTKQEKMGHSLHIPFKFHGDER